MTASSWGWLTIQAEIGSAKRWRSFTETEPRSSLQAGNFGNMELFRC